MQLDAEEDADAFYKPPVMPLAGLMGDEPGRLSGETQVETAATATAEQDE